MNQLPFPLDQKRFEDQVKKGLDRILPAVALRSGCLNVTTFPLPQYCRGMVTQGNLANLVVVGQQC